MALNHELHRARRTLPARGRRPRPAIASTRCPAARLKPGLLRVAEGGVAIATEVWALPPEAFGRFVAGIPAPLGIGTLRLADGTHPKGFLVEPEALTGAKDMSKYGGWRAYMASRG